MESAIDQEFNKYFVQLSEAEKKSVLQMIKTFLKGRKQNSERISLEQYNREINEALEELEKGEVYTHEDVVKMSKDW